MSMTSNERRNIDAVRHYAANMHQWSRIEHMNDGELLEIIKDQPNPTKCVDKLKQYLKSFQKD
jgi:hypothetical protein